MDLIWEERIVKWGKSYEQNVVLECRSMGLIYETKAKQVYRFI